MKAMRAACAAAIFLGVSVSAPLAWADTSTAETLFQEGLAAMKRNDFTIACEAFDKSNKQDASPGTQINLAICYEKQKKWASAWTWYRSAAGLAQQRNQPQREQNATDAAKRLEPQLHHVTISIKNAPPDTVVKRDGNEITVSLGGRDVALPFDPGDHTIEIKANGKKTLTKNIVTPDTPTTNAQPEILSFSLEDAPVEPTAGLDTTGPSAPKTTVIRTESDGSTQRTIGLIVGGAGVLTGLAAAGVFVLANKEASDRDTQRAVHDDPTKSEADRTAAGTSANSHNDAANNDQLIALILTGGAVVMVGLGAVLFFTAPKAKEKTAKIMPMPIAGPNFQGLGVVGTF